MNAIVLIDEAACTGCGLCVKICPKGILSISETTGTCVVSDEQACDRLRGCQRKCPAGAIKIS